MKPLPYFSFILSRNDKHCTTKIYVRQFDKELLNFELITRFDFWENSVFKTCKYPSLSKVSKAALFVFTGPQMEVSFRMMNDIIGKHSRRMDVATCGAIMNVKYSLITNGKSSFQWYHCCNDL